jgi:hypothetical protein
MEARTVNILTFVAGVAFLGYLTYRIYKYQMLKSGNLKKDERKINIQTS